MSTGLITTRWVNAILRENRQRIQLTRGGLLNVEHSALCRFDTSRLYPTTLNLQDIKLCPDHLVEHDCAAQFLFKTMVVA